MSNMKFKVDVAKIVEIIKKNKIKHVAEYSESAKGWFGKLEKEFADILTIANENKDDEVKSRLSRLHYEFPKPVSHADSYDKILGLLAMSKDPTIELDMESYSRFIEDDWEWKNEHSTMYRNYQQLC